MDRNTYPRWRWLVAAAILPTALIPAHATAAVPAPAGTALSTTDCAALRTAALADTKLTATQLAQVKASTTSDCSITATTTVGATTAYGITGGGLPVVSTPLHSAVVQAAVSGSALGPNSKLYYDEWVQSSTGAFRFEMQSDGNLVEYSGAWPGGVALWASNTSGHPGAFASMQADGNLVVYDINLTSLWATTTWGHSGAWGSMQNDGNFVIYTPSLSPLWATGANTHLPSWCRGTWQMMNWNVGPISVMTNHFNVGLCWNNAVAWTNWGPDTPITTVPGYVTSDTNHGVSCSGCWGMSIYDNFSWMVATTPIWWHPAWAKEDVHGDGWLGGMYGANY